MRRLVRGLASSRTAARLGFSTCLTGLLSQCECVSTAEALDLIDTELKVTGRMKGEVRVLRAYVLF